MREPTGGPRDRVQERRLLERRESACKLQQGQDSVDLGRHAFLYRSRTALPICLPSAVHPDSDFECMGVLMEHTQDVKCVAWHPTEEVCASCHCLRCTTYDMQSFSASSCADPSLSVVRRYHQAIHGRPV